VSSPIAPGTHRTADATSLSERIQALRDEFDLRFAEAPVVEGAPRLRFLGVRVAGDPFALRLDDIVGLHVDSKAVLVPGPSSTLLGIASFRGAIVAVHDLHGLLGYPSGGARRWWILVRPGRPVGLAFDQLDGHFEADSDAPLASEATGRRHIRGATLTSNLIRPIIDVASALGTLAEQSPGDPLHEERR